ncbi:MAG TPA: hypothetical protein VJQ25_08745, partial [Nitrospira sp.]|nr:hypothetical protein [Nitrospira sp.]
NGSYYGQLNDRGIPKTVYVRGYLKKDGTYVSSYYRSPPSRIYALGEGGKLSATRFESIAPSVAENGSYYGQMSDLTGLPKTVYVNGYYKSDGTYVRSHYRSHR